MKKRIIMLLIFVFLFQIGFVNVVDAKADELSESVRDQFDNIDFSELDNFFDSLNLDITINPSDIVSSLLRGEFSVDYNNILGSLLSVLLSRVKFYAPIIAQVLAIAILSVVLDKVKSSLLSNEINTILNLVFYFVVVLVLSGIVLSFYKNTKNTIENIVKLAEIMSPIIITLMIAAGGKVSAAIYTPTVAFLSNNVMGIALKILLPLVGLMTVFSVISNASTTVKLNKFSDLCVSSFKWILGILFTVYTFFLSAQGLSGSIYDGISIKAAKYTISNSIPIVGGFLRDGFDLVVAGSVLIKNATGIAILIVLVYTVLNNVLDMIVFSWLLKLIVAICESISCDKVSNLCLSIQKSISYFIALILIVSLMLFITILLMIISANAFI